MKTAATSSPAATGKRSSPSGWVLFLRYWLPVLLWMLFIFGMSTNAGSTQNTSRIIGPILRWFDPTIPDETIRSIQLVIRKCAHFTEYGILAALLWRARRKPLRSDSRPWLRSHAAFAFLGAAAFAVSDEWHQSYVPSREGSLRDVLIDCTGAAFAVWVLWWVGRHRRKW